MTATLRREAMEESQVTVAEAVPLGFEEVHRSGRPVALVRMVGRIGEFLPRRPDPDGGRLFRRLMTTLGRRFTSTDQPSTARTLVNIVSSCLVRRPSQGRSTDTGQLSL